MSYILDALKKADSERERGAVPGLHTQPVRSNGKPAPSSSGKPLLWLAAMVVLLLLGAILWLWLNPRVESRPAAVAMVQTAPAVAAPPSLPAAPPVPAAPVMPPVVAAEAAPAAPAPIAAPVAAPAMTAEPARPPARPTIRGFAPGDETRPAPAPPEQADASSIRKPRPQMAPAQVVADSPNALVETPAPLQRAPAATRPAPAAPSAAVSNSRVVAITDLPPAIQQGLPKLLISGATYSDNPAWRMLIINGQVFHEGEKPAAELTLEQIRPKSAVLNYRGQRYSVGY